MAIKSTNNLDKFLAGRINKAEATLQKALILGGSHASMFTPIDTSTLLNSAYRQVTQEGGSIVGRYGYRAEYASYVHDPNVKQNFRRPTAKKEFLKLGFEEAKPLIDEIFKKELGV